MVLNKLSVYIITLFVFMVGSPPNIATAQLFDFFQTSKAQKPAKPKKKLRPVRVTLKVMPVDARIRIMNIKSVYKPGIKMVPGSYHFRVDKQGFETWEKWLKVKGKTFAYKVDLKPVVAARPVEVTIAPEKSPVMTKGLKQSAQPLDNVADATKKPKPKDGKKAFKRVALVIGIDDYETLSPLSNPVCDAGAVAALFRKHGVKVAEHLNLDHTGFEKALDDFAGLAKGAEEAIIFYAGHGMTAIRDKKLANVLAPIDANISCATRTAERTITMARIVEAIKGVPKQVLLFDSCRNNPIRNCESNALTATLQGFQPVRMIRPQARVSKPRGAGDDRAFVPEKLTGKTNTSSVLVAYSTDLGAAASDGDPGKHSPFAAALLAELNAGPSVPLRKILDQTSSRVAKAAGQRPWVVTKGGEPEMCLRGRDCETSGALKKNKMIAESLRLAALSKQRTDEGDPVTGMLLALEGLPDNKSWNASHKKRPFLAQAALQLDRSLRQLRVFSALKGHGTAVRAAKFSPDGKHIATTSDGILRLWDVGTSKELTRIGAHDDPIHGIEFSHDSKLIVTADDYSAKVWDIATRKELAHLQNHTGMIRSVAFSPDDKRIVTASFDNTARVWDTTTGKEVARFEGGGFYANFSPDSRRIVVAGDETASVWGIAEGKELLRLKGHYSSVLKAIYSPDGKHIVTAWNDGSARVWDTVSGNQISLLTGHTEFYEASFSADGKRIVTASGDGIARVWDVASGKQLDRLESPGSELIRASFSPDGKHIVTASYDGSAQVWGAKGEQLIAPLTGHKDKVNHVTFSPDGKRIATASDDGSARVWDAASGKQIALLTGHSKFHEASFSADGKRIVTASSDGIVRVWDVASGKQLDRLESPGSKLRSVSYSPDGRRFIAALRTTPEVRDAVTHKELFRLGGHEGWISSASFNSDGKLIVTASADGTARIWNASNGKELIRLKNHCGFTLDSGEGICRVNSATFSPDSQHVVTTSEDNTARVWDVRTGKQIALLEGHHCPRRRSYLLSECGVNSAAFSPDGRWIATASDDLTVRFWRAYRSKQELVDTAKDRVQRCLTVEQRKQFNLSAEPPAWCYDLKKWPYHKGRGKPVAAK